MRESWPASRFTKPLGSLDRSRVMPSRCQPSSPTSKSAACRSSPCSAKWPPSCRANPTSVTRRAGLRSEWRRPRARGLRSTHCRRNRAGEGGGASLEAKFARARSLLDEFRLTSLRPPAQRALPLREKFFLWLNLAAPLHPRPATPWQSMVSWSHRQEAEGKGPHEEVPCDALCGHAVRMLPGACSVRRLFEFFGS